MYKPTGQPTIRTPEMIAELLARLEAGETLTDICKDEHMPERTTIYLWTGKDPELNQQVQRAKDVGYDAMADGLRQVARGFGDSSGDVARDKLIVDTDVRLLARWCPKRYGDRQIIVGDKAADPVRIEHDYSRLSVDELRTLMQLAEKAAVDGET
jgi:hypothetical protein